MGGEKANGSDAPDDDEGSPPRRRGKSSDLVGVVPGGRITPAWAGKSRSILEFVLASQDHPRTCGEKTFIGLVLKHQIGSPPHGRGKVRQVGGFDGVAGITPTRAGKRARCPCWCAGGQDHPRVGGEKREWRPTRREKSGSSPRGRGKVAFSSSDSAFSGITPAWAGKRAACWCRCTIPEDHPRVGGEKSCPGVTTNSLKGLPPRGRGKEAKRIGIIG